MQNDGFDKLEGNFQLFQAITKDTTSERQEKINVQEKMKQPISKKKLAAMKEREMEKLNLTFLKSLNEKMKARE